MTNHSLAKRRKAPIDNDPVMLELASLLENQSEIPLYRQIASRIETWIEEGRLQPGYQLASERRMTDLLQVSRRTVRAALGELIQKNYVSATHGRGNFVMQPPHRRKMRFLSLERFTPEHWRVTPYYYDLVHQAEEEGNWTVHYKYAPNLEKLWEILVNPPSGYHGILIVRPVQEWVNLLLEKADKISELPIPILIASRDLTGSSLNFVSPNHFAQTWSATRKLIELGHKRIAYISGQTNVDYLRITHDGYVKAMADAGLETDPQEMLFLPTINLNTLEEQILTFLARRTFSAVVVAGSAFSSPFEKAVQKSSIVIPDQLSACLITEQYVFSNLAMRWNAYIYPDQTVITRSLKALYELSLSQTEKPIQELIAPQLTEGASFQRK